MKKSKDYKFIVVGDASVGKTSIIIQYHLNTFDPNHHETVGASFISKQVEHENKLVNVNIWDTAGQEKYRSLVPMYTRNASCAMIIFDVTNPRSFEILVSWYQQVKEEAPEYCRIIIVGNKIDEIIQIPNFEDIKNSDEIIQIENFAYNNGVDIFYVSAKNGINIQDLFKNIINNFLVDRAQSQNEAIHINTEEKRVVVDIFSIFIDIFNIEIIILINIVLFVKNAI